MDKSDNQSDGEEVRPKLIDAANEPGKKLPQFLAAFAGNLASVVTGCIIGWTSPSLVKLSADDSPIHITDDENSWISSLMPLAAAVGPFAAGYAADRFGRKKAMLFISLPMLVSWISLAAGLDIGVVYFGRIVAGFCVGWVFTVLPMYCGEIAEDSVRGAIGSLMQVFVTFGLLFVYSIGPYVPYMWLSIGAAVIPVLFVASFFWMPESPYYLLAVPDKEAAKKSLEWLRGKSGDGVEDELQEMQGEVKNAQAQTGTIKDVFATKGTTKALIISLGLVGFQQLSGINVVLLNAEEIFKRAGGSLTADVSTIITGVVMLAASFATPVIVDRLGRRVLLLVSASGMAIAQGILGLYFFLDTRTDVDTDSIAFLPILSVMVYIVVYSTGFGPLPWAIMGEMFPANIKSLSSTLTASFCWLLGFFITRFFNDLVNAVGMDYTFWIFGIFCALAIPFLLILLPETKGKSFAEIQEMLNR